jgi:hypothetical protein
MSPNLQASVAVRYAWEVGDLRVVTRPATAPITKLTVAQASVSNDRMSDE